MAVINPLKVTIENYPEHTEDLLPALNHPGDETLGSREIPFSRELYIERDDFMEEPPKKFFRLAPGREVRLRYAYFITCTQVIKDATGKIIELRCSYDPKTRGGNAPDGRKVKATLHWVSAGEAALGEVRIYNHLFSEPDPGDKNDIIEDINPHSLNVLRTCQLEPSLADFEPGQTVQFERLGYFCPDPDGTKKHLIFNRTLGLRDSWEKFKKGRSRRAG